MNAVLWIPDWWLKKFKKEIKLFWKNQNWFFFLSSFPNLNKIYLQKLVKKFFLPPNYGWRRLSQRVAMDDLASYFVEERSKVR